MGAGRKTRTVTLQEKIESTCTANCSVSARNLRRDELGAVIFGCKNYTYKECISKQLFGLPAPHFSYVKNVSVGLPLFLFNYTDRMLHGIFEAASPGKLNIDPYGWTKDATESTPYEAQVRVQVRTLCHPLNEDQFASIIGDNYYHPKLFWFELDRSQTKRLVDLFSSSPVIDDANSLQNPSIWNNSFRSLPVTGPIEDSRSVNTDTTGELNCGKSHPPLLENSSASTSTIEPEAFYPKKLWSSLFKSSASDMDKTDPILISSPSPSSPLPDKHIMDSELCLASSANEDGYIDGWGLGEHDESKSLMQNESISPSHERQYTGKESEHLETIAFELNLQQLNELEIGGESSSGESENAEFCIDNDNVQGWSDGSSGLTGDEEEDQRVITEPFLSVNTDSEDRNFEVVEIPQQVNPSDLSVVVAKLMEEVEELKRSKLEQDQKIMSLEQDLAHSRLDLQQFKNMYNTLETGPLHSSRNSEEVQYTVQLPPETDESVVIVGGFNGSSWLSSLDSYFPFRDHVETLGSITFSRSYASAVKSSGELFLLGGRHGHVWVDTVESFNPWTSQWMQQPSMNGKKGNLAGASLEDKIFAIGGGNGEHCFSEMEVLDFSISKWIIAPSIMRKRFASAAVDINGAIYVVGGYDGTDYLKSVERFDPREDTWTTDGDFKFSISQYESELHTGTVDNTVEQRGPWSSMSRWALESYLIGDVGKAFLLYSRMAELGYEVAQSNAAWILDKYGERSMCLGESGICSDEERYLRSHTLWWQASEQGNEHAALLIGDAYYYGRG